MAVGAGVARPGTPVLAIVGDGGLAVYLGELATLAAERSMPAFCGSSIRPLFRSFMPSVA